uniref:Uncharacterized protein n=1 Tax=Rhizophora mucronata TaxID=61149 RepID=A0A2P2PF61_RHIMU
MIDICFFLQCDMTSMNFSLELKSWISESKPEDMKFKNAFCCLTWGMPIQSCTF